MKCDKSTCDPKKHTGPFKLLKVQADGLRIARCEGCGNTVTRKPAEPKENPRTFLGETYIHLKSGFSGKVVKESFPHPWIHHALLTLERNAFDRREFELWELKTLAEVQQFPGKCPKCGETTRKLVKLDHDPCFAYNRRLVASYKCSGCGERYKEYIKVPWY